jgi:hypothetical protein
MRKRDIVARALQRLGVVDAGAAPEAHEYELGLECLEQLFADLNGTWGGCTLAFTIGDEFPAAYQNPFINLLASRLAVTFERTPPEPETTALMRLRAVNVPYVRDMDLDEDGTTDDCEIEAFDRGLYF